MPVRLWEYRNAKWNADNSMVCYQSDGIFQAMVCDREENLLLHVIEESDHLESSIHALSVNETGTAFTMDFESGFYLVPKLFLGTVSPEFTGNMQSIAADENLNIQFSGKENQVHAFYPFYFIAKKNAQLHANYVQILVHGKRCMLAYFRDGNCVLSNIYHASNDSEVLYFAMAAVKLQGQDIRKVHFELLGNQIQELFKVFQRFISDIRPLQMTLPYTTGEYPPYAAEASLMHQFLLCELQVAI
ncbi:MAG: DUF3822 family protein [Bacteroidetes bacterium]|nr:DUF3822 family protein [Bacteroidota bacterium]